MGFLVSSAGQAALVYKRAEVIFFHYFATELFPGEKTWAASDSV